MSTRPVPDPPVPWLAHLLNVLPLGSLLRVFLLDLCYPSCTNEHCTVQNALGKRGEFLCDNYGKP